MAVKGIVAWSPGVHSTTIKKCLCSFLKTTTLVSETSRRRSHYCKRLSTGATFARPSYFWGTIPNFFPGQKSPRATTVLVRFPLSLSKLIQCCEFLNNLNFYVHVTVFQYSVILSIVMSTCLSVRLSVCLSDRISPEPHARSLPIFLRMLPMTVVQFSSGRVTKSEAEEAVFGVFHSTDNPL